MDNYRELLQKTASKLCSYYEFNQESYDAYDSFICALKKYNIDVLELRFNLAGDDVDYRKALIQVIFDLRFARDTDLDYDSTLASYDSYYLNMIMEILMHENEEFYDEFGSTSAINYKKYEELCKKYELVI